MTWKALEWHGIAGTEWRMQVGGERLGRVGIAVAGQDRCGVGGVARGVWLGTEMQAWKSQLRQGVWRVAARWGL